MFYVSVKLQYNASVEKVMRTIFGPREEWGKLDTLVVDNFESARLKCSRNTGSLRKYYGIFLCNFYLNNNIRKLTTLFSYAKLPSAA